MTRSVTKDTTLCISLAARPSNLGTRFHNFLYDELGLDFLYKAFAPADLRAAVAGIRGLGIRGCGVSMPYKEEVIDYVDELDPSAAAVESVNTLVNDQGRLTAYNTDVVAVRDLLGEHGVGSDLGFAVVGSGGMAKAVVAALRARGFADGLVVARNAATGRALADRYGYAWADSLGPRRPRLLVNATPVGMAGGPAEHDLPVDASVVEAAETVVDVVAVPARTPLVRAAQQAGTAVVSGAEIISRQAVEQFVLYTGVRPTAEQVERAARHSRE